MQDNMFPITRPDLNETRDRLRALPRTGPMLQQTIQYLTRAAQGAVPMVEPFVALSELNEIKRDMEKQSSAQATAGAPQTNGPLVQTLPEQVKQTAGIAGLQAMRQRQAMQNMMGQAGQTPGPVPEGLEQSAPIQAASGGLLTLPSARFRSGGIVTFKEPTEENNDSLVTSEEGDDSEGGDDSAPVRADTAPINLGAPIDVTARLNDLNAQIEQRANQPAPALTKNMVGPTAVQTQMAKDNPELYGILSTPAGSKYLEELRRLQGFQAEDIAQRGREIQRPSIGRMLIDAAEASRGVKGGLGQISAMLMGAGKSANNQRMQALKEEQALRQEGLGLAEARMAALSKVDDLRRAQAKGDVSGEYNARLALAKIAKDHGVSINNLLGRQYSALLGYKGRVDSATIAADARKRAAATTAAAAASADKAKLPEQLGRAEVALTRLTPGTPEHDAKQAEVNALRRALQTNRDVGPERAFLMRQQLLVTEDKDIRSKMADFEFSPEMMAAKLVGPEEENRVFMKKLSELRGIGRTDLKDDKPFPEPAKSGASAPRPEPLFIGTPAKLPAGLTGANASKLLKEGEVYETAKGPGRWNGTAFVPVKMSN